MSTRTESAQGNAVPGRAPASSVTHCGVSSGSAVAPCTVSAGRIAVPQDGRLAHLNAHAHSGRLAAAELVPENPAEEKKWREWYSARSGQPDRLDLAVIDRSGGGCVGEPVLSEWNPGNQNCSFRIALGPAGRRRGLGTEATRLIVVYGFERLVPVTIAAVTGTEPREAGLASGLMNTAQQIGGALGLAVLATIANSRTQSAFHASVHSASIALTKGFDRAFLVGAGFAIAGAILAAVLISSRDSRKHAGAARTELAAAAAATANPAPQAA
jgi:hypothetical protein